jgi:magnesium and cobalt exporter, CNNM family
LLIDGLAPLADVRERLGIELDDVPAETVSGLVLDRLGRVAAVGDAVHADGVRFEVVAIDGRRIDRVRATRESPARSDEPTGASPSAR